MRIVNPTARLGEDIATRYLTKKGYRIVERNFRKGYGEIDIIAIDSSNKPNVLVFVEVKTRTNSQFGTPFEAITSWKLRTLVKTSQYYKLINSKLPDSMRIDAISVKLSSNEEVENIEHIENISGF